MVGAAAKLVTPNLPHAAPAHRRPGQPRATGCRYRTHYLLLNQAGVFPGDHGQVGPERVSRHVQETLAARGNLAVAYEAAGRTWAGPSPLCQADDMRKYVIMGIQGSGKGTQAKMLAADLDLVHISVGDIFRWNVQNHTKMGAQVRRVMATGELVGDDLVESVVRDRLTQHDWNFGFIIDGFPRNRRQAEFFLESYDIDGVIVLDLPDSEVRRRVLNRRLCADCGMDYHLIDSSPKVEGRCDSCGGDLVTREDDTEEALAVRLRDYHEKTNPVIDLFRGKEYVFTVDARSAPDAVQEQIRKCLGLPPMTARKSRQPGAAGA